MKLHNTFDMLLARNKVTKCNRRPSPKTATFSQVLLAIGICRSTFNTTDISNIWLIDHDGFGLDVFFDNFPLNYSIDYYYQWLANSFTLKHTSLFDLSSCIISYVYKFQQSTLCQHRKFIIMFHSNFIRYARVKLK